MFQQDQQKMFLVQQRRQENQHPYEVNAGQMQVQYYHPQYQKQVIVQQPQPQQQMHYVQQQQLINFQPPQQFIQKAQSYSNARPQMQFDQQRSGSSTIPSAMTTPVNRTLSHYDQNGLVEDLGQTHQFSDQFAFYQRYKKINNIVSDTKPTCMSQKETQRAADIQKFMNMKRQENDHSRSGYNPYAKLQRIINLSQDQQQNSNRQNQLMGGISSLSSVNQQFPLSQRIEATEQSQKPLVCEYQDQIVAQPIRQIPFQDIDQLQKARQNNYLDQSVGSITNHSCSPSVKFSPYCRDRSRSNNQYQNRSTFTQINSDLINEQQFPGELLPNHQAYSMLHDQRRNTSYTPQDNTPLSPTHDISNSAFEQHSQNSYSATKQVRFQPPPAEIHRNMYTRKTEGTKSEKKKSKSQKSQHSKSNKSILSRRSSLSTISKKSVKKRSKRVGNFDDTSKFLLQSRMKSPGDRRSKSMKIKKRTQAIIIQTDGLNTQQLNQLDKVSKILNNEFSPKNRSKSNKSKKSASATHKLTIVTNDDFKTINSVVLKSPSKQKVTKVQKEKVLPKNSMVQSQQFPQHFVRQAFVPANYPQATGMAPQGYYVQEQQQQQPIHFQNGVPLQFMTMYEYTSPKYTIDYAGQDDQVLQDQINKQLKNYGKQMVTGQSAEVQSQPRQESKEFAVQTDHQMMQNDSQEVILLQSTPVHVEDKSTQQMVEQEVNTQNDHFDEEPFQKETDQNQSQDRQVLDQTETQSILTNTNTYVTNQQTVSRMQRHQQRQAQPNSDVYNVFGCPTNNDLSCNISSLNDQSQFVGNAFISSATSNCRHQNQSVKQDSQLDDRQSEDPETVQQQPVQRNQQQQNHLSFNNSLCVVGYPKQQNSGLKNEMSQQHMRQSTFNQTSTGMPNVFSCDNINYPYNNLEMFMVNNETGQISPFTHTAMVSPTSYTNSLHPVASSQQFLTKRRKSTKSVQPQRSTTQKKIIQIEIVDKTKPVSSKSLSNLKKQILNIALKPIVQKTKKTTKSRSLSNVSKVSKKSKKSSKRHQQHQSQVVMQQPMYQEVAQYQNFEPQQLQQQPPPHEIFYNHAPKHSNGTFYSQQQSTIGGKAQTQPDTISECSNNIIGLKPTNTSTIFQDTLHQAYHQQKLSYDNQNETEQFIEDGIGEGVTFQGAHNQSSKLGNHQQQNSITRPFGNAAPVFTEEDTMIMEREDDVASDRRILKSFEDNRMTMVYDPRTNQMYYRTLEGELIQSNQRVDVIDSAGQSSIAFQQDTINFEPLQHFQQHPPPPGYIDRSSARFLSPALVNGWEPVVQSNQMQPRNLSYSPQQPSMKSTKKRKSRSITPKQRKMNRVHTIQSFADNYTNIIIPVSQKKIKEKSKSTLSVKKSRKSKSPKPSLSPISQRMRTPNRGDSSMIEKLQEVRELTRKAEIAKHKKQLSQIQKQTKEKLKHNELQHKNQVRFFKHQLEVEKQKTQSYMSTIKEMHDKLDEVSKKNSNLFLKMQAQKQKYKDKLRDLSKKKDDKRKAGSKMTRNYQDYQILASEQDSIINIYKTGKDSLQQVFTPKTKQKLEKNEKNTRKSKSRTRNKSGLKNATSGLKSPALSKSLSRSRSKSMKRPKMKNAAVGQSAHDKYSDLHTYDGFMNGEVKILDNNDPRIYGSQALLSRNDLAFKIIKTNEDPKTERVPVNQTFQKQPDQLTYTTQTTSESSFPSVNIGSISAKLRENHREIKRIESILYNKDKKAVKKESLPIVSHFDKKGDQNSRRTKTLVDEVSLKKLLKIEQYDKNY